MKFLKILWKDITINAKGDEMIVNLGLTKGGKRRGCEEMIVITDATIIKLFAALATTRSPGQALLNVSSYHFRKTFGRHLHELGVENFGFWLYSLRRGGATCLFKENGNLSLLAVRGRWSSQQTARIYVNDGMRALAECGFPAAAKAKISFFAQVACDILQ